MSSTEWSETSISSNECEREFTSDGLFEWHYDEEFRSIRILSISGTWHYIEDNSIPVELLVGSEFRIEAGVWHRIRPSANVCSHVLKIQITE